MKKLLFLFSLFILVLLPNTVFALDKNIYEFDVNNTNFANDSATLFYSGSNSYTLQVDINASVLHNYYIIYLGMNDGNYSNFEILLSGGCNYSCFSQNFYLKQINFIRGSYYYAVVLPRGKADCGVGTGQCLISNFVTIQNRAQNFNMFVLGVDAVDDDTIINNNYQGFVNLINNSNTNTQDIINNQNQNSQDIINNQNQNQQQTNQNLGNINNSLNDDSGVPQNDVSDKTNEWASKLAGTGPVSNMVLMPITLLNGYINGFNSTCSPYNLGNLMGTDIILPCINISNYLGATLWNVIDVLFSGFMIYAIGKKFVKIFNDFTNLRDNQMDDLYGGGK